MGVIGRAALSSIVAAVGVLGLASAVLATAPLTGTGAFRPAGPPTTISVRAADGNTIVEQLQTFIDTGVQAGTETDTVTFVFHPDGTFNLKADVAFTGTVAGRSGTLAQRFEGTGDATTFHGQLETLSGTGDLANLRAHGTFVGSSTTGAGTYTLEYHFDP
jgi:Protein of unknown function (DUF3224)